MNQPAKLKKDWVARCLTVFGDLKVFHWPFFLLYDPGSYLVKGDDMRQVIQTARPGDILVRGYVNYLDGYFIPGYFSHAGLYLGKVDPDSLDAIWSDDHTTLEVVKALCKSGEQMVIHSMAEGVFMEDLLNFCRCDYMAILRFPERLARDQTTPEAVFDPAQYSRAEKEIAERLKQGEEVSFAEVFPVVYKLALSQLGRPYDFRFNFSNFDTLSCSEYVYYCTKCLCWFLCLSPREKRVLFVKKTILEPDAFACCSRLELVWHSKSVDGKLLAAMRGNAPE